MRSVGAESDRTGDVDHPLRDPLSQTVARIHHRHQPIHVGLELHQAVGLARGHAVADALELDPVAPLERLGERDEVLAVHLERVGVRGIADHLVPAADLAVPRRRPPSLRGVPDEHHGTPVVCGPLLHGLERRQHLVEIVPVVDGEDVPSEGDPLLGNVVALVLWLDHAADQRVVDTGVVEGHEHTKPLPHLLGDRDVLELLGVPLGQGELPFEGHDLEVERRPDVVPEDRLAGRRGDPDSRTAHRSRRSSRRWTRRDRTTPGCRGSWPGRTTGGRSTRGPRGAWRALRRLVGTPGRPPTASQRRDCRRTGRRQSPRAAGEVPRTGSSTASSTWECSALRRA